MSLVAGSHTSQPHKRGHDTHLTSRTHSPPTDHARGGTAPAESCVTRRGLVNLGNTCYVNACIQALASVPQLQHGLMCALQQYEHRAAHDVQPAQIAPWTMRVCDVLRALGHVSRSAVQPDPIINHIQQLAPSFRRGRAEDSHEALVALLQKVHAECVHMLERGGTGRAADHAHPPGSTAHSTVIQTLFQGLYRSTRTCPSCDEKVVTYEPFLDVTLSIDDDDAKPSMRPSTNTPDHTHLTHRIPHTVMCATNVCVSIHTSSSRQRHLSSAFTSRGSMDDRRKTANTLVSTSN